MIQQLFRTDRGLESAFLAKLTHSGLGPALSFSTSLSVHANAKSRRLAFNRAVKRWNSPRKQTGAVMKTAATFKQADIKRAIRGAQSAGVAIAAISITVFGEITLQIKDPDQPGLRDAND
nr:hypothetical protein [uncultured Cohaesibacter sp.]